MKRVVSMVLCVAMLMACALSLSSCSTTLVKNSDGTYDKGAYIDMYIGDQLYDFNPLKSLVNYDSVQLTSLLYEGLTKLDENGKWQKAMMDEYTIETDKMNGDTLVDITLKDTRWSDGRTVQAQDFMYAWRYVILDPNTKNEAASMLYDIKNAREAKAGDCTVGDIGITCPSTYVLELRIDKDHAADFDIDRFFTYTASPALVPIREDIATKGDWWAKKMTSLVTNGPFAIKELAFDSILRLDRNQYYMLDQDKDSKEKLDKYVIPYRLITHYDVGDAAQQLEAYKAGYLNYLGEIPVSARNEYKSSAKVSDEMNTLSALFNLNNPILADARVRQALSLALNRQAIADELVFADPATGLISNGVVDANGKAFKDNSSSYANLSSDLSKAKSLLDAAKSAGKLPSGKLTISVKAAKNTSADANENLFVAEKIQAAWSELLSGYGITVEIKKLNNSEVTLAGVVQLYYNDDFQIAYDTRNFDVILCDSVMLSSDAYATLAPYAFDFSGNGVDMESDNYDAFGHASGYNSDAYNKLIADANAEKDAAKRSEILHNAEAQLMEDLPVMPIIFTKKACLIKEDVIENTTISYLATADFTRTTMKDYMKYKKDYDNQILPVYSSIISYVTSVNEGLIKELGSTAYWSTSYKTSDFYMTMNMDEFADKIASVRSAQTSRKEALPVLKWVLNKFYEDIDLGDINAQTTFLDIAIKISSELNK